MKLKIRRNRFYKDRTIGQLYINDEFYCFTMEDTMREKLGVPVEEWKIPKETAIPTGLYRITLETSKKFGENTIFINDVPGFTGIRVHAGNSPKDTEGCVMVGYRLTKDNDIAFGMTRPALYDLKTKIKQAILDGEEIFLDIVNT